MLNYIGRPLNEKRFLLLFLILFWTNFTSYSLKTGDDPKDKVRVVVLDAGHGGKDTGALGKRSCEKDITLSITLKVGEYIKENIKDVKVVYTRDKDEFVPLYKRAEIANSNQADLFISIHANSHRNNEVYGSETYAMGEHTNEKNLEVAMKENSVITLEEDYTTNYEGFDPTSAESYIIFTLIQKTYLEQSLQCASYIQDQFRDRAKRYDRGVKQAGFLVLWRTTMPSVLVETGYISNSSEEKYLLSENGQAYLASAIYRAFKEYKQFIESRSNFTTAYNDYINDTVVTPIIRSVDPENATLTFMVQIASSQNPIPPDAEIFKGLHEINLIKTESYYKYAVGNESSYDNITTFSQTLKSEYQDAFIIAVKKGEIIPLKEALEEIKH